MFYITFYYVILLCFKVRYYTPKYKCHSFIFGRDPVCSKDCNTEAYRDFPILYNIFESTGFQINVCTSDRQFKYSSE
jgi:hypothetical protein